MVIKHFSQRHPLSPYEVEKDQDIICSICEEEILPSSQAYKCNHDKRNSSSISCEFFHLHKKCYELPREIQHASHPQHPLTLLSKSPSNIFTCAACAGYGSSFVYNCAACEFALHVRCSSLEESVTRADHQHPLHLVFSLRPEKKEDEEKEEGEDEKDYRCGVCGYYVFEGRWAYLCKECGFVTHLDCVTAEAEVFENEEEEDHLEKEVEEEKEEEEVEEEKQEEEEDFQVFGGKEEEDDDDYNDDNNDEEEEDALDVIARNEKRIFVQQMIITNQMHMRRMRMQRAMIMDNTRRLFQFRL